MPRNTIVSTLALFTWILLQIFLFCQPVRAWQITLTDVTGDLELGTTYYQEINFYSDTGTDNLNNFFLTLDYDESLVSLAGITFSDYGNWDGGSLSYTDDGDLVYNIMGAEPLGSGNSFFPAAGDTLLVTIGWTPLVAQDDVTVAEWGDADASDFVTVDERKYWMPTDDRNMVSDPLLSVYYDSAEDSHVLTPAVPAVGDWLLGLTMIGMVALVWRYGGRPSEITG
jgi:hypothetical protein